MKRCPTCNRVETDETLKFCRADGTPLVSESESPSREAATAQPASGAASSEVETSILPHRTGATVSRHTVPTSSLAQQISGGGTRELTPPKRRRTGLFAVLAVASVVVAGMGYGFYRYAISGRQKSALSSFAQAKLQRLTSTGKVTGAAISPDGKYVAHVVEDGGLESLWVRQTATSSNVQIVPPAEVSYWGLTFSPDGNYVYYSVVEKGDQGTLYQVAALGGATRKLLTGIRSAPAFSPDGKQIAFLRKNESGYALMVANADGTGERELVVRRGAENFYWGSLCTVSWSPDGKTIASPVYNWAEGYATVAAISVDSGEVKLFTPQRWHIVKQVAWLADGSGVLLTAGDQPFAPYQMWQISYPSGEAHKLTSDLNSYLSVSFTADGSALATVQSERIANIYVTPTNDTTRATQITRDRNFNWHLTWTPDGRIIYQSNADGNFDLYLTDTHGGNPKQLTTNSRWNGLPSVSPDGRYIVFTSTRTGRGEIWRMEIDGSNPKQLTHQYSEQPKFSPDGQWIVYISPLTNGWYLWKIPFDGGEPVRLTDKSADSPAISPDGKQIACYYWDEPNAPMELAIFSSEGGQPIKTFALPGLSLERGVTTNLAWTTDGRAVVYGVTRGGVSNLWAQPVDGGQPKQITNFTSEHIYWFDFSRDGKQLALSRGTQSSDVVLISNFK